MAKDTLYIAITGHVDHGKSTLIGRLLIDTGSLPKDKIDDLKKISKELGKDAELAYLIDQLKEEREENKTIDTTQTFIKTKNRDFVIIDTPGHTEFLKNMLTGASMASAAVLIVDAHEGIMEQTRRHAYLLSMIGIEDIIVVLNKMDVENFDQGKFNKLASDLSGIFGEMNMKPAFMIPISAREGINIMKRSKEMDWYKGPTLIEALGSVKIDVASSRKPLRFPVQDVYDIDGKKVLVGGVSSGTISRGQKVILMPSNQKTGISSIKLFEGEKDKAGEGENIGVIIDRDLSVKRGDVIVEEGGAAAPSNDLYGEVFWMSDEPLKIDSEFTLRIATQETEGHVASIFKTIDASTLKMIEGNKDGIKQNEVGMVAIKTAKPVIAEDFSFIEEFGRFVIEKDNELLGAGIVRRGLKN
jgi:sulfate adenylyltransferase large subunit